MPWEGARYPALVANRPSAHYVDEAPRGWGREEGGTGGNMEKNKSQKLKKYILVKRERKKIKRMENGLRKKEKIKKKEKRTMTKKRTRLKER